MGYMAQVMGHIADRLYGTDHRPYIYQVSCMADRLYETGHISWQTSCMVLVDRLVAQTTVHMVDRWHGKQTMAQAVGHMTGYMAQPTGTGHMEDKLYGRHRSQMIWRINLYN